MKFFYILIIFSVAEVARGQSLQVAHKLLNIPSSIRGLSVANDNVVWFSGSQGYVGRSIDGGNSWNYKQLKGSEALDFRSLYAFDSLSALIANAGSPAHILKTNDGGRTWKSVYLNNHAEIFLDGMDFWDEKNGLIYGDPIEGRMTILKTNNGGDSWIELLPDQRPQLEKGEASFAASGTGIRCFNKNEVVIATGGVVSRLWISKNHGEHWEPRLVPIVQGKSTTGIFSIAVRKNHWVVVGGDYQADSVVNRNVFYSLDAGRKWDAPTHATRGYRSGVESIRDKIWIAVGQRGIDFTTDDGRNWMLGPEEEGLHVVRRARNGSKIFAAGNGSVVVLEIE